MYRLFQEPGEYVVTFPAAYHAGFSHGFNMAEACNFALPEWLPWGRRAVEKYRHATSQRALCFSHEQLLCNMARHAAEYLAAAGGGAAAQPHQLAVVVEELAHLVAVEGRERLAAMQAGVALAVHLPNEADPRYECVRCRQICYLSAVICRCAAGAKRRVSCLRHVRHLCGCEPANKVLVYWYRLEDLQRLVDSVAAAQAAGAVRPGPLAAT